MLLRRSQPRAALHPRDQPLDAFQIERLREDLALRHGGVAFAIEEDVLGRQVDQVEGEGDSPQDGDHRKGGEGERPQPQGRLHPPVGHGYGSALAGAMCVLPWAGPGRAPPGKDLTLL